MDTNLSKPSLDSLSSVRSLSLLLLAVLSCFAMLLPLVANSIASAVPTPTMLFGQDLVILPLVCIAIASFRASSPLLLPRDLSRPALFAVAASLFMLGVWGHSIIFYGIDLTRDEQMATFDAEIFRSGHLAQPLPLEWRAFTPALNQLFILPIGDHAAWVSSYLPVNAAMRALVSLIVDPVVTSPLLVSIAFLALAAIGRRLWPETPGARLAALLCFLGSSQILITGMTAFAMSAHLAFNLIWLLMFLRDDRASFVGTIVLGFLATGIHQPLFHPLFALPFVLDLAWQRRWRRLSGYSVGYALISIFWLAWPLWMSGHAGPVPVANDLEGIGYATRLFRLLALLKWDDTWTMTANLIRFITWQHLLLLPLALLGVGGVVRWPLVRPLATGVLLPIVVMGLLLPWQGHGWGYRYLHPVLGNLCLLAGYGWHRAETREMDLSRPMWWTTAASLLVLLPIHGWMARTMVVPQALPEGKIARINADVAIVDAAPFSINLVINRPDLSNRPIRLEGDRLRPADMEAICRNRTIAFVDAPAMNDLLTYYEVRGVSKATAHQRALREAARAARCRIVAS